MTKFLSFKERFDSFSQWPRKYSVDFILSMCVSGLYSTNKKTTKCVYCKFTKNDWGVNDSPSIIHSQKNCLVYNMHKKKSREKYNKLHGFECNCTTMAMEIEPGSKLTFCANCGRTTHCEQNPNCCECGTIKKFGARTKGVNFHSNLFQGHYNGNIMKYIETKDFDIPDDKMDVIEYILENTRAGLLENARNIVETGLTKLSKEIEEEMKELAKSKETNEEEMVKEGTTNTQEIKE